MQSAAILDGNSPPNDMAETNGCGRRELMGTRGACTQSSHKGKKKNNP